MPRDASGTHSLPSGNPVVTATAISSTVHNNTTADLSTEITDSLSRSGKGAMTAPLKVTDGTVSAPTMTFASDLDSGFYRAGADDVRLSLGNYAVWQPLIGKLVSKVANGATAVAHALDTVVDYVTSGAKLLSLRTNGIERFYVDKDGGATSSSGLFQAKPTATVTLQGQAADGGSAVGAIVDNVTALVTAGAKLTSFRTGGVEKSYLDINGNPVAKNTAKAWAWALKTAGSATLTLIDQFNVASITMNGGTTTELNVVFSAALSDPSYCVVFGDELGAGWLHMARKTTSGTVNGFTIVCWNLGAAAPYDFNGNGAFLSFAVFG